MKRLETFPPRSWLVIILAISFFAMLGIWFQFLPLEDIMTRGGGYGIVDYELAFTPDKAAQILNTWDSEARAAAYRSLGIDYVFMPSYALFFGAVTLLIARAQTGKLRQIGFAITIGCILAGLLDALENAMLLSILNGPPVAPAPPLIASVAASIKFLLLLLPLIYWPVGLIALILRRRRAA
jgi:hypothetical protein